MQLIPLHSEMRLSTLLPVFLASYAVAAPSRRANHVVHETRAAEPLDWVLSRRLESHKVLPMRFGLTQRNIHRLEELVLEVSHPESPKYGQHYTPAEVIETFAPSHETISAVTDWLVNSGFSRDRLRLSGNKGWIHVNATTAEAEELLDTEYHVYTHPSGGEQIGESSFYYGSYFSCFDALFPLGCKSYSVPVHVREHIDLIKPTVHFIHHPNPNALQKRGINLGSPSVHSGPKTNNKHITLPSTLANCDEMITPDCLRALYSIDHKPVATAKNSFGIGMLIA